MSDPIAVQCPHCKSKLKIKSRSAVGKKVPCPKCQKPFVVALPKPSAAAKTVASPKQPKQPEPKKPKPAEDEDLLDDLDGLNDDYEAEDDETESENDSRPAGRTSGRQKSGSKGASSEKGAKKKKKPAAPAKWKMPAMIGGGAALVVLLLLLLFLFLRPRREAPAPQPAPQAKVEPNKLNLAYLPPGAELVVHVRMTDVWNAPLVKQLMEGPEATARLNEWKASSRELALLDPAQIDSVTVGVAGVSAATKYQREKMKELGMPDLSDPAQLQANLEKFQANAEKLQAIQHEAANMQHTIAVVRMKAPLPNDQVSQTLAGRQSLKHHESTYYLIPSPQPSGIPGPQPGGATVATFLPDQSTVVLGAEVDVKSAIERGAKEEPRADLDFVDPEQHVLLAFVPQDATLFETAGDAAGPLGTAPGMGWVSHLLPDSFKSSMKSTPNAFSLGLVVTNQVGLQLRGNCKSESDATANKSEVDAALKELNAKFAEKKDAYVKQFPNIIQTAQSFVDSIGVKQMGTTIEVTAAVPDTIKAASPEFLPFVLAMSLGGGLGQPEPPPAILGAAPSASSPTTLDPAALNPGTLNPATLNPATPTPGTPPTATPLSPGTATTPIAPKSEPKPKAGF